MVRLVRWLVFPALLGFLAAAPVEAQNRSEYVQDEAAFFSGDAKAKANAEIARISSQFKKELVVDTVFSVKVPADIDSKNEKRYLDEWAAKRAAREKVNGIAVVIVGEPPTIRVELSDATKGSGLFSVADEQELRNQIVANMKETRKDRTDQKKKDHVLLAAVAFVHDRMSQHWQAKHGQQAPAQQPVPQGQAHETPWLMYILIGIGVLLVLWIIRGVLRGLSGGMGGGGPRMAGGGYGGGGYGGGGGGGGFMSSMLGGLFGAAAGMWMYNNVFGGHSNSAWGAGPTAGGTGPAAGNDADAGGYTGAGGDYGETGGDQAGTDAGGGGGDWGGGGGGDTGGDAGGGDAGGGDAGGGDAGGGDAGGGDAGGGDAGGGGDWGGGGGGDFGGGGGGDFGGGGGGGGGDW